MRKAVDSALLQPLIFEPLFMERIWGGRRLEALFGKRLPTGARIGESWEIVDRPEAQSTVRGGPWGGRTLHDLWLHHRREVFGEIADSPRFPLLVKLLDAQETLSLQVHPPSEVAADLGGESKTEFWYIADAKPGADLYVGLKKGTSRAHFEAAITSGALEEIIHRIPARTDSAMFLPAGRVHAIGAGNVIVEIQQNSDTTYRLFDWNRTAEDGTPRTLHIEESLRSVDFQDYEPELLSTEGETLVKHPLFNIEKWDLTTPRAVSERGTFAIVACLAGELRSAEMEIKAGEFLMIPASLDDRLLKPVLPNTALLRVTIEN